VHFKAYLPTIAQLCKLRASAWQLVFVCGKPFFARTFLMRLLSVAIGFALGTAWAAASPAERQRAMGTANELGARLAAQLAPVADGTVSFLKKGLERKELR
jgi:hypothetical protein